MLSRRENKIKRNSSPFAFLEKVDLRLRKEILFQKNVAWGQFKQLSQWGVAKPVSQMALYSLCSALLLTRALLAV
jgi:hypothetical protein